MNMINAKYPEHFKKAVEENECVVQQVFNLDETCLF
jgi:ribosomal protein S17E